MAVKVLYRGLFLCLMESAAFVGNSGVVHIHAFLVAFEDGSGQELLNKRPTVTVLPSSTDKSRCLFVVVVSYPVEQFDSRDALTRRAATLTAEPSKAKHASVLWPATLVIKL